MIAETEAFRGVGSSCGLSGTITSSKSSCPTALIVNATRPLDEHQVTSQIIGIGWLLRTDTDGESGDGDASGHILEKIRPSSSNQCGGLPVVRVVI